MDLTSEKKLHLTGVILILCFNVLSAAKEVYAANLLQSIPPSLMIFICFLITAVYFNLLKLRNVFFQLSSNSQSLKNIFWINISTLGGWFSFFYAIKYIEPAMGSAIAIGIGPLLTVLLGKYLRPSSRVFKSEIFASMGIFLSILIVCLVTWFGKSGLGNLDSIHTIIGLGSSVVCGISMVGNTFFGKRLHDQNWDAAEVMSVRFFMLIFVSGYFSFSQVNMTQWLVPNILSFIIIAVIGIIVPLYCLQRGIEKTEPITVSLVLSAVPLFTFLIQFFDKRIVTSASSFLSIIFVLICVCMGILGRYRKLT